MYALHQQQQQPAGTIRTVQHCRSNMMLSYRELTDHFISYAEKKDEYWRRLQGSARYLCEAFGDSLSLESTTWKDLDGMERPYVELGAFDDGEFVPAAAHALRGSDDLSLSFAIKLTLEYRHDAFPKSSYIALVQVKEVGRVFEVTIKEPRSVAFRVQGISGKEGYTAVCEAIKSALVKSLSEPAFD
jgi:hypothetical protein